MAKLWCSAGLATAVLCAVVSAEEWSDDFDAYETGSPINGQGGWQGTPVDGVIVTDQQALSAPNSLSIIGGEDDGDHALYLFDDFDATSGVWSLDAHQFVPSHADGRSWFILLNESDEGSQNWSTQIRYELSGGRVVSTFDGSTTDLRYDAWTMLRVVIDLDRDLQRIIYDGDVLVTKSWSQGVSGGGQTHLEALSLYGDCCGRGGTEFYYDDVSLCETCAADVDGSGAVDLSDLLEILAEWGPCPPDSPCWHDLDSDGGVRFPEILAVLGAWGPCGR